MTRKMDGKGETQEVPAGQLEQALAELKRSLQLAYHRSPDALGAIVDQVGAAVRDRPNDQVLRAVHATIAAADDLAGEDSKENRGTLANCMRVLNLIARAPADTVERSRPVD